MITTLLTEMLVEIGGKDSTWTVTAEVSNGQFRTELPRREEEPRWVIAHYLGGFGSSPSESERREL